MSPAPEKKPPSYNESLRRFVAGLVGIILVVATGIVSETGRDGGFVKDAWNAIKVPSPAISMVLIVLFRMVWREWMKDRAAHALRTDAYVIGMNRAAELREDDKREKQKLREENEALRAEVRRRNRR